MECQMEVFKKAEEERNWKGTFDSFLKKSGKKQVIQFLLDSGLDINTLNKHGKTMLSHAAELGNMKLIKFLTRKGADGNVVNSDGSKPLHIAAQFGRKNIVKYFIRKGISADSCDNNKNSLLHYVAKCDTSSADWESCRELVHFLLNGNANLEAMDKKRRTPLLLAAEYSRKPIVDLFIELGANVNCGNEEQWTLLHYSSCRKEWSAIARSLLEGNVGFDLNATTEEGYTAVHLAAVNLNKDIVELLVNKGANVDFCNEKQWTLLHFSCSFGWTEVVRSLVEGENDIDLNMKTEEGYTALQLAATDAHQHIVELLIELGANFDFCSEDKWTLLHYSCRFGWTEVVQFLLEGRFNIDLNSQTYEKETPLYIAARNANKDIVELFLELAEKVDFSDEDQWEVLRFSCIYGWKAIVQSFLDGQFNINFNSRSPEGYELVHFPYDMMDSMTVVHYSCVNGWLDIVKNFVNSGCDINNVDCYGRTPLLIAAEYSQYDIVKYLIDLNKTNLEHYDYHTGYTVLHYACEKGWLEPVTSFIKKKYDLNVQTIRLEETPLHCAVHSRSTEIISHLLEAGADWNVENSSQVTSFDECINTLIYLKGISLFIENGAYIQCEGYNVIIDTPLLKKGVLQDAKLCTQAVINHLNNVELPKIYKIPVVPEWLPPIEKLKIASHNNVVKDIEESVIYEIQNKGYCDILNARPIVLSSLCLRSLIKYYDESLNIVL